jgi:peptide-methionine (S)-S-oxide reductase
MSNNQITFLGAGCFWGVEETLRKLEGVTSTKTGYMGGDVEDPTYEDVCSGKTGHTEVVKVEYNPGDLTFEELLEKFWKMHSPVPNPKDDVPKKQYKSVIYYINEDQKKTAKEVKQKVENDLDEKIMTEILPADEFFEAAEKHQKYYKKLRNS